MVLGQNGRAVRIFNNRIDVNIHELNRFDSDQIGFLDVDLRTWLSFFFSKRGLCWEQSSCLSNLKFCNNYR